MVSYQLHGGLVHLGIRFTYATMAASVEHSICLLLPSFGGMQEYFVEDHQPVRGSELPPGILIQEKFHIQSVLRLSYWKSAFSGSPLGHPTPPHPSPHTVTTIGSSNWRDNKDTFIYNHGEPSTMLHIKSPTKYDSRTFYLTTSSVLDQENPDHLLNYFTML